MIKYNKEEEMILNEVLLRCRDTAERIYNVLRCTSEQDKECLRVNINIIRDHLDFIEKYGGR